MYNVVYNKTKGVMKKVNEYLTANGAAKALGINWVTLRKWVVKGQIKAWKDIVSGRMYFDPSEIERILNVIKENTK